LITGRRYHSRSRRTNTRVNRGPKYLVEQTETHVLQKENENISKVNINLQAKTVTYFAWDEKHAKLY
jgi:hypothetical protein